MEETMDKKDAERLDQILGRTHSLLDALRAKGKKIKKVKKEGVQPDPPQDSDKPS